VTSLIGLAAGCSPAPHGRTNVLLVSIDTLRDDHCSVSGYALPTTPGLERLAAQGTRIELAYAPTATTGPTHASILTSLYPIAHGVVKNGVNLDGGFETLAETLSDAGYGTAGVVSSFVLDAKFGYGQGFDTYDDDFDPESATIDRTFFGGKPIEGSFDQIASRTTDKAARTLQDLGRTGRPFFLFVHYFDPHNPYVPPEPFSGRFVPEQGADDELSATIAAYDAEIAYADHEIDRLLEVLAEAGLEDDTLVVVVADHGEGLMQRGHMHHGVHIYEEAVRVPLLFRLPGRMPPGQVRGGPVELVDLMPTVLELVGLAPPEGLQGRSLVSALAHGASLDPQRAVFLQRRHYKPQTIGEIHVAGEKFGVRKGTWKYIEGDEEAARELYDLQADPGERVNLVESNVEVADELRSTIAAWKQANAREGAGTPELSPEDVERLKALGYLE